MALKRKKKTAVISLWHIWILYRNKCILLASFWTQFKRFDVLLPRKTVKSPRAKTRRFVQNNDKFLNVKKSGRCQRISKQLLTFSNTRDKKYFFKNARKIAIELMLRVTTLRTCHLDIFFFPSFFSSYISNASKLQATHQISTMFGLLLWIIKILPKY